MKQLITIIGFLLGLSGLHAQHSPVLSQYMFNGLPLNPAVSGSRDALAVQLGFRRQWVGIEGAPKTESLSIHAPMEKNKLAMGLMLMNDRIGVTRSTGLMVNAAYRLKVNRGTLSFGLAGGMIQRRNDWDEVITGSGQDNVFGSGNLMTFDPEFSAGIYYYTNTAYVSLSAPFILGHASGAGNPPPKQGPSPGPGPGPDTQGAPNQAVNFMLNTGFRFAPTMDLQLTPSVMVRSYGSSFQMDLNLMAMIRQRMELGVSYRTQSAVVAMGRFRASDQIHIGYAYDLPIGAVSALRAGGHEVTMSYDFRYKNYAQNPRFF